MDAADEKALAFNVMERSSILALVGALLLGASAPSRASDTYNGEWTGSMMSYANRTAAECSAKLAFVAANDKVTGTAQGQGSYTHITGAIASTGTLTGKVDQFIANKFVQFDLTGQFTGDSFVGSFVGRKECGLETIYMNRLKPG